MLQTIDFSILDWIQANLRCGFLDFVMPKLTLLGEHGIFLIAVGLVLLFFKSERKAGVTLLSCMAFCYIAVNKILKNIVARPRPCAINTSVELLIPVPGEYSFPSGHTMYFFLAATILMRYDKRLGIPALVLAVLVAFSRLYLYVHFPSDVLAGAVIGVAVGLLGCFIAEKVSARYKDKKANKA